MDLKSLQRKSSFRQFLISGVLALVAVIILSYAFRPVRYISLSKGAEQTVYIQRVIDGDTVVAKGGERIRYAGIDTPERGEPYYKEAKERNSELVLHRNVRIEICTEKPRDRYGRLLAWIYVDDSSVEETLLREGLARVITIPPCGLIKAERFRAIEEAAKAGGVGMWRH